MGLLTDSRNDRGRDRGRDNNRTRSFQESKPKDTYYRKEYGWIMSNADVEKEQGVKKEFDKNTDNVRAQIESANAAYLAEIERGRAQITGAYGDAISGAKRPSNDLVPVRVVNGSSVEATYMIPRSSVNEMAGDNKFLNGGDGTYYGSWVDDGKYFNIDVKVKGAGKRGQELHDALRSSAEQTATNIANNNKLHSKGISNANKEMAETLAGYEKSSAANYASARATWDAELQRAQAAYGKRVDEAKKSYEDSKAKYNQSVLDMDAGLLENPTNTVKQNVQAQPTAAQQMAQPVQQAAPQATTPQAAPPAAPPQPAQQPTTLTNTTGDPNADKKL